MTGKKSKVTKKTDNGTKSSKKGNFYIIAFLVLFILICISVAALFMNIPEKSAEAIPEEVRAGSASGQTAEEMATKAYCVDNYDEIQQKINSIAEENGAVGVQVAVIEDGNIAGLFSYGWAELDSEPMTVIHKIRSASISKVFIGIAAMLLYEDGIIDIDKSISEIWGTEIVNPYYPDNPVTIRNMLNHTSSIFGYEDNYSVNYTAVKKRFTDCYVNQKPGDISAWYYNNYVFRVLGMTLELAAQKKLDDILYENVFSYMNIDAAFAAGDIENTDYIASLYDEENNEEISAKTFRSFHCSDIPGENGLYFAGGLTISVFDLAKVVCMLINDGEYEGYRILEESSVELMETCFGDTLPDGTYQGTPLVYMTDVYGRNGIFFHTGSAYGAFNCMSYDPVTGDGVIILTTGAADLGEKEDIRYVCDDINEYIYQAIR